MIIGIVGLIGSGKGTVGDILHQRYGFWKESFAKPLKDAASCIFGWDRALLEGDTALSRDFREKVDPFWSEKLGREDFTPRLALQLLGTEAGREVFGNKLWTTSCIQRCNGYQNQGFFAGSLRNFVITDCRFRNEIDAIREVNGIIWRVERGEDPDWLKLALNYMYAEPNPGETKDPYLRLCEYMNYYNQNVVGGAQIHQSEWDWVGAKFDYVFANDGTLADLEKKVYDKLAEFKIVHVPFKSTSDLLNSD